MRAVHKELAGWGGVPRVDSTVYRPEAWSELRGLLDQERRLLPRGLGRAYGDAALLSDGATVLTERLDRFLDLDLSGPTITVEAGATLEALLDFLLPKGLVTPVVPGTNQVTVGGMIAADIHGKAHHVHGSFGDQVEWIDLLLPSGELVRTSLTEDPELFNATCGGMGLTGFIVRARLKLMAIETAWIDMDVERARDYREALEKFEATDERYEFTMAWIDCAATGKRLGRSVLMRGNWATLEQVPKKFRDTPLATPTRLPLPVPVEPPLSLINRLTVTAFNTAYFHAHPVHAEGVPAHYVPFTFPLDTMSNWNRVYGPKGFLQYQCVVPTDGGVTALGHILEAVAASGLGSNLSVLKRFGEGAPDRPLSFPMKGYTLAVDLLVKGEATDRLLEVLDDHVQAVGGRLYLAKDARMDRAMLERGYPRLADFEAVRRRVDPEGRLRSDLAVRLGLA